MRVVQIAKWLRRELCRGLWPRMGDRRGSRQLIDGLAAVSGVRILGLTRTEDLARRVPTVSFDLAGHDPAGIPRFIPREGINVWSGHNYGVEPVTRLGLLEIRRRRTRRAHALQHAGRDRPLPRRLRTLPRQKRNAGLRSARSSTRWRRLAYFGRESACRYDSAGNTIPRRAAMR